MQKPLSWLLAFALLIGGSFLFGKKWSERRLENELSENLDNGFRPADFPLENRSFVVVICGHNNGAFVEKTLRSVFSQVYEEYRVIYIDDASTDGSFEAARDAIYASGQMLRTTIAQNEQRLGHLANLVRAIEACSDREIVVVLGGEDGLAHEWVLSRLNQYYADSDLWLTYGQSCESPSFKQGSSRSIRKDENLRDSPFAAGHLKSFYAGLFKKIAQEDLMEHGIFFPAASDLAVMLPMLEMAGEHFQFIPEILYLANRHGLSPNDSELQARCERAIRSLKPYQPLAALHLFEEEL